MKWLHKALHHVGRYVQKPWYPLLLGFLAFIDIFIFVIPTDGLMISSAMTAPKRGLSLTLWTTIGSTLGSLVFAILLNHGVKFADVAGPEWTQNWFAAYGLWALFGIALLPVIHHPILVLACLAKISIFKIGIAVVSGRLIKFGVYAWLCTHAPKLLLRSKHLQKEIKEVQEDIDSTVG